MSTVTTPEAATTETGPTQELLALTEESARTLAVEQAASFIMRHEVQVPKTGHWVFEGECTKSDADGFFPKSESAKTTKEPKKNCGPCTVRAEWLVTALLNKGTVGVWAGTSTRQRTKWQKRIDDELLTY